MIPWATDISSPNCSRTRRIGGRSADYHRAVETAFRLVAIEEPERVRLIDASGSAEEVTARLIDAIADLLP